MRRAPAASVLLALVACGEPSGPPAPGPFDIAISGSISSMTTVLDPDGWPMAYCEMRLTARTSGAGQGVWEGAVFRWYMGLDRSTVAETIVPLVSEVHDYWGRGTLSAPDTIEAGIFVTSPFPFEVEIDFDVRTNDGGKVVTRQVPRMTCGPRPPATAPALPSVAVTAFGPSGVVQPGDKLRVDYSASAAAGLWLTQVAGTGAFDKTITLSENSQAATTRSVQLEIPTSTQLNATEAVAVYAVDPFGQYSYVTQTSGEIQDTVLPQLQADVRPHWRPQSADTLRGPHFTGDSLIMNIQAWDNHRIAKVVWELFPSTLRDSVIATEVNVAERRHWRVATDWPTSPELRVTAYDVGGNTRHVVVPSDTSFRIRPTLQRPAWSLTLDADTRYVRVDQARNVAYLSQSDGYRIAAVNLDTRATTPIQLNAAPAGLDLSLAGDSLFVALPGERALAVIDLRPQTPTVTRIPLTVLPPSEGSPMGVATLANGRVFISISSANPAATSPVEVTPSSGQQRVLAGADPLESFHLIESSAERNVVVLSDGNCTQTYDVAADTFGPCVDRSTGRVSVDATGQQVLVGQEIYSAAMTLLRPIPTTEGTVPDFFRPTLISPEGGHVYAFEGPGNGFVRSSASTGEVVDRTPVPQTVVNVMDMQISRGGRWLTIVGASNNLFFYRGNTLLVVDLLAQPTIVNARR